MEHGSAGLFLDPGLRKTSIVLAAVCSLMRRGLVTKTVVVAPPRVCTLTWPAEVAKWKEFAHLRVVLLHGPHKDELLEQDADVYLVSYNSLDWFLDARKTKTPTGKIKVTLGLQKLRRLGANCLVCDELSKARNHGSLTFKMLSQARDHFDRVYGMTGSPAPRSLLDLFGVMYVIDGGYSFGPYITHYRSSYFLPAGYGGFDYKLQPGAKERIFERIAPFVFRLEARDYIKLPELVENVVRVELPASARKAYDAMEKDFFVEFDKRGVAAVSGGVAYGKCRQIANGGLLLPRELGPDGVVRRGKREWVDLHTAKAEAVADMVEELSGQPALVVYEFQHDLARLRDALGKDTPNLGGGVSPREAERIVEAWNAGELPVLLVHAASVSHGLNLQGSNACHVLWHSLTDNYDSYDQLIRRLLRSGNDAPRVFSQLFVAQGTVDELSVKRTRRKAMTQNELKAAVAEYTAQRLAEGRRGRKVQQS